MSGRQSRGGGLVPSRSRAQQRLMRAAEHGADFPMAKKVRASMTSEQLHDFASGAMADKPAHVPNRYGQRAAAVRRRGRS